MSSFIPHGQHIIAGERITGPRAVASSPASGPAHEFSVGTPDLIASACAAAEAAFPAYATTSRPARAAFLDAIADAIEARGPQITEIGTQETGLPPARLEGERGRTTGQLRLFAAHIRDGTYLDRRHDAAEPLRTPAPRPEIRMIQRPVGPVAVFGASNFPLAFSTAGGDTAAALAAGCTVVVKGHPAHPGTAEIIAGAIIEAAAATGMPAGVFSLVQDPAGERAVGAALVTDPNITAVGFTGSLNAGRALFDLCAARPQPIPFFGELGSVNPMFVLPAAATKRSAAIGQGWAGSLTMGAGQFCTNPGIAIVVAGAEADSFIAAALAALEATAPQVMLTQGIAAAYREGKARLAARPAVRPILDTTCENRSASPSLYTVDAADWLADRDTLGEEVFGPLGLVILAKDTDQMLTLAQAFAGQLTATLQMEDADTDIARRLLPVLERKAGRVLVNGFPTGVEVVDSMVHGGPYPASTNFGATSVGTMSIRRFLRPVAYQNLPDALLPEDLRS